MAMIALEHLTFSTTRLHNTQGNAEAPISLECDNWRLVHDLFTTISRQRLTI